LHRHTGDNGARLLVASKDQTRCFPTPVLPDGKLRPSPLPTKAIGLEETWCQPRPQRRSQGLAGVL